MLLATTAEKGWTKGSKVSVTVNITGTAVPARNLGAAICTRPTRSPDVTSKLISNNSLAFYSQDFTHSSPSSPTQMTFPVSRATSPTSLGPFRFGSRPDDSQAGKGKEGFLGTRSRRSSTNSRKNGKGKEPAYGKDYVESSTGPTASSFGELLELLVYNLGSVQHYEALHVLTYMCSNRARSLLTVSLQCLILIHTIRHLFGLYSR